MAENETNNQTSAITRRKLMFGVAGGVIAGAVVGSLVPKELIPYTENEKDQQFFDAFTSIENANSAKWEYYDQKMRSIIEDAVEKPIPGAVLQFLAVATFTDGASLAVSKIENATEMVERRFRINDDGAHQWSDQAVSFDQVLDSLSKNDLSTIRIEFISQPYPVNYEDTPLSTLLQEVDITPQSNLVQKAHNVQLERNASQDIVRNRDIRTNYMLVGEPNELGLNSFKRDVPDGLQSRGTQSVSGFGERNGGWNTVTSETQQASIRVFEEEFQGLVKRS